MTTRVDVGGHSIAVHELGGGAVGPAVVLLHGASFHARVWDAVARRLTGVGRVVALDLPAHGRSSHPEGELRWAELAHVLLGAIDGLGLVRPVVAGHSMGAALAILGELERPGSFAALWAFEPVVPPRGVGDDVVDDRASGGARRTTFPSHDHVYERYAGRAPLDRWDPEVLRDFVHHGFEERPDGSVELLGATDVQRVTVDWCHHGAMDRLGALTLPVLLVRGAMDHYQAYWVPEQAARIPGVRVEVYEDQTHVGPMEDPVATAASISRFVGSLPVPDGRS